MISTVTQHHVNALTELHHDHPYTKSPVYKHIVQVEGKTFLSGSYQFSEHDVTLCSLSSTTNLSMKPGRKKPNIIFQEWWAKFKRLSKFARELYPLDEIKKFKGADARLTDWLEEQLKQTTAVRSSCAPIVKLAGNKHAQHWIEDLHIELITYPEWILPDDRKLIEEMTQFACLVDQKRTHSSLECLSQIAPGCFAAFADNDSLEQWQKSRTGVYTSLQLKTLKDRMKRLFSYSKLSFPKQLKAPVSSQRSQDMNPEQVRILTEHDHAFFKALSLSPVQRDFKTPAEAENPK